MWPIQHMPHGTKKKGNERRLSVFRSVIKSLNSYFVHLFGFMSKREKIVLAAGALWILSKIHNEHKFINDYTVHHFSSQLIVKNFWTFVLKHFSPKNLICSCLFSYRLASSVVEKFWRSIWTLTIPLTSSFECRVGFDIVCHNSWTTGPILKMSFTSKLIVSTSASY